jgi:hypothetical protein
VLELPAFPFSPAIFTSLFGNSLEVGSTTIRPPSVFLMHATLDSLPVPSRQAELLETRRALLESYFRELLASSTLLQVLDFLGAPPAPARVVRCSRVAVAEARLIRLALAAAADGGDSKGGDYGDDDAREKPVRVGLSTRPPNSASAAPTSADNDAALAAAAVLQAAVRERRRLLRSADEPAPPSIGSYALRDESGECIKLSRALFL